MSDQAEENKNKLIEMLLRITREWYAYEISISQSMKLLRLKYKNVSDKDFEKITTENDVSDFLKLMVEAYAKYLTVEDIKGLIVFYNSDLGRKIGNIDLLNQLNRSSIDWIKMVESSLMEHDRVPKEIGDSE